MLFSNRTNSAYITLVAGTLSEFISGVFFYLYNRTIIKMAGYHHKLYYTQNISLALRTANEMKGEEQAKAQQMIIEQLTKDINLQIQPAK